MTAEFVGESVGSVESELFFFRLTVCGEEAPVTPTLDNLSSWLRQPEVDEFLDRRNTICNVERPAFPEKLLDIFLSKTHGSSVIRQGYGV